MMYVSGRESNPQELDMAGKLLARRPYTGGRALYGSGA